MKEEGGLRLIAVRDAKKPDPHLSTHSGHRDAVKRARYRCSSVFLSDASSSVRNASSGKTQCKS